MKLKTVAIFGGAFNPPTLGHVEVARAILDDRVLEYDGLDEVWLMPCFKHQYGKEMLAFEGRMTLCKLAIKSNPQDPRIMVSDFESWLAQHFSGYDGSTFDLMMDLSAEKGEEANFEFVIGLDNALEFNKWKRHEDLQGIVQFIVIPRPGYQHDPNAWYMQSVDDVKHYYLADVQTNPVSSTQVREALHGWKRTEGPPGILRAGLNPLVLDYIVKNNLYVA